MFSNSVNHYMLNSDHDLGGGMMDGTSVQD